MNREEALRMLPADGAIIEVNTVNMQRLVIDSNSIVNKIYDDFDQKLKEAFMAGWNESGEGWNAEYGVRGDTVALMCEDYVKENNDK